MTDTIRDLLISLASHMAYMQGTLEARHELDPKDYYWYRESVLLRQKVTDVLLADEPAVPEGREPAAVAGQPSDEDCWQWYTYCPEEGLEMYSDREQAQSAAQSIMGSYEVAAHSDGWHEDMESVSWGMLVPVEQAQVVECKAAEPNDEFDEWVKYELRPALYGHQPAPPSDGEVAECAALAEADEPAVPEGREPAAVTSEPSDEELADVYWTAWHEYHDRTNSVLHAVGLRAVLARWGNLKASLTSSPPADGEVAELAAWLYQLADKRSCNRRRGIRPHPSALTRAAVLLQRQVLAPVAVSERLPGPEDCNAEGKCWLCGKVEGDWRLINPEKSGVPHLKYCFTHWLPAHALPLPEVNND